MTPIQKSIAPRAWAELLLLALIWGASFLSNAVILRETGVLWAVAWRVAGAAAVLWLYVFWRGLAVPRGWRTWGAFLGMGLLNNVIPFSLLSWGQLHIASGLTSILNAATAVFGTLTAALIFADERLSVRKLVGVGFGFMGVATAIGLSSLTHFDLTSLGQIAVIGATISYAFAGPFGRINLSELNPEVAAAGMLTGAFLIMLPIVGLTEGYMAPQTAHVWGGVAYLSLIATGVAYAFYYRVLKMAGSGNVLLVTLLVAPVAIVLGAVVLEEQLQPRAYAGFALLAVGLVILDGRLWRRVFDRKATAG